MRKIDAEIVFTAAVYASLFPAIVADGEDEDEAMRGRLHQGMYAAHQEAKYLVRAYTTPHPTMKFGWHRKGKP